MVLACRIRQQVYGTENLTKTLVDSAKQVTGEHKRHPSQQRSSHNNIQNYISQITQKPDLGKSANHKPEGQCISICIPTNMARLIQKTTLITVHQNYDAKLLEQVWQNTSNQKIPGIPRKHFPIYETVKTESKKFRQLDPLLNQWNNSPEVNLGKLRSARPSRR